MFVCSVLDVFSHLSSNICQKHALTIYASNKFYLKAQPWNTDFYIGKHLPLKSVIHFLLF